MSGFARASSRIMRHFSPASSFSIADLRARCRRLQAPGNVQGASDTLAGDHMIDPSLSSRIQAASLQQAAVLVAAVPRADGPRLILTRRTDHLKAHAGQIAFPGGKIDAKDAGPLDTALREAREEVGLSPHDVEPLGWLDPYISATGYRIFPLIALARAEASLSPNADEVADLFEVPLAFLMSPDNHILETAEWGGRERRFYAIPYEDRRIWGVTAGIIRLLYEQIYR